MRGQDGAEGDPGIDPPASVNIPCERGPLGVRNICMVAVCFMDNKWKCITHEIFISIDSGTTNPESFSLLGMECVTDRIVK